MDEYIRFANENPICYLATIDKDQPRVRALGFWFADKTGFYFQTGTVKPFYHQLRKNPKTEVCFYRQEGMIGKMMRLEGEVEFLDDLTLKERVLRDRPFLKIFGLAADSPGLIIFRISHGKVHFWTMENNLRPKNIVEF